MRHFFAGVVCIAIGLLMTLPVRGGDDPKKVLEALSGDWRMVKIEGGKFDKIEKGKEPTMTFSGAEATVKINGMEVTLKITLDPSKKPAHIDFVEPAEDKQVASGIYKLDKDKLTICVGVGADKVRPAEFALGGEAARVLVLLERVK